MKLKSFGVIVAIVVVLTIGSGEVNVAYATEQQEQTFISVNHQIITPFWNKISSISPYISATGTTLYPEVYISAKSTSSSISGTMYLQRYSSGSWVNVTSWSINGTGNVFLSKSYRGTSGSRYRVKVVVNVAGEKAEATSGTCGI